VRLDDVARPQGVGALLDDLAVDLLPAKSRPLYGPTALSRKAGARLAALTCVAARLTATAGS
jgi:hypothetical protein